MSISSAAQRLKSVRRELESHRVKQAAEEKKAAALEKESASKARQAGSTNSASMQQSYSKQAVKKREDATAARSRAAKHGEDAAKAQAKVHDAEVKLREEEQREEKMASGKREADAKKAAAARDRTDRMRDDSHRREVGDLRARIDEQDRLLAAAPWEHVPDVITVLFIASSPEDQHGLRIDREMRDIQMRVRQAEHRDALRFEYAVAAQPTDLLQRLNEVKPDVVHFSGHSSTAGFAMEDSDGLTRLLSTRELAMLLSVSSRRIHLAVFNSCESASHAAIAVDHLDAAIGMGESINDEAARNFAGQLYSSIAFGLPVSQAFAQAMLQVQLSLGSQSGEPQLFVADGVDADELFLVRPAAVPAAEQPYLVEQAVLDP
ncbi:MAG: CHAT domain-containing protein [Jatrophihabitantaceae bacterium]